MNEIGQNYHVLVIYPRIIVYVAVNCHQFLLYGDKTLIFGGNTHCGVCV